LSGGFVDCVGRDEYCGEVEGTRILYGWKEGVGGGECCREDLMLIWEMLMVEVFRPDC